jgi:hypothetical protein
MADWLYAKIGEIESPIAKPPLDEPGLLPAVEAFTANTDRIRAFWALNPLLIQRASHAIMRACEAACAVTGHLPLTEKEKKNPAITRKIQKRITELLPKKRRPETAIPEAIAQFDKMIKDAGPVVDDAIYATLCAQLTTAWTAFETLTVDLWEAALNSHPATLANLSGSQKRILKLAGKRRDEPESGTEDRDLRLRSVERITKGTFKIEKVMGTLLKDEFRFDKLRGIRQAYAAAFSKRSSQIDAILADKALDRLNLIRNVILHKAGTVDQKFLDGAAAISWKIETEVGKPVPLDGQVVKDLVTPVFRLAWDLVFEVDEWIRLASGEKKPNDAASDS